MVWCLLTSAFLVSVQFYGRMKSWRRVKPSLIASGLQTWRQVSRGVIKAHASPTSTLDAALSWKSQLLKLTNWKGRPSRILKTRGSTTIWKTFMGLIGTTTRRPFMLCSRRTLLIKARPLYRSQAILR